MGPNRGGGKEARSGKKGGKDGKSGKDHKDGHGGRGKEEAHLKKGKGKVTGGNSSLNWHPRRLSELCSGLIVAATSSLNNTFFCLWFLNMLTLSYCHEPDDS